MNDQAVASDVTLPALAGIAEWLEQTALRGVSSQELIGGLGERMGAAGIPLSRMTAMVDTLHPVHEGSVFRWIAGEAGADTVTYGRDYDVAGWQRSEEHTSELQSLMRIPYAVFCLINNTQASNA